VSPTGDRDICQGFDTPSGIAFDKKGDLFVADSGAHSIKKIDAAGKMTSLAGIDHKAAILMPAPKRTI